MGYGHKHQVGGPIILDAKTGNFIKESGKCMDSCKKCKEDGQAREASASTTTEGRRDVEDDIMEVEIHDVEGAE